MIVEIQPQSFSLLPGTNEDTTSIRSEEGEVVYPLKEHAVIIDIKKLVKEQYLYCQH